MRRWLLVMLGLLAALSAFAGEPAGSDWFAGFGGPSQSAARPREFLHPDQAFTLSVEAQAVEAQDPHTLLARFAIEDGYYLYKDKLGFESQDARVALANVELPAGKFKEDPEFGRVEVYTGDTAVRIPLVAARGRGPGKGGLSICVSLTRAVPRTGSVTRPSPRPSRSRYRPEKT